MKRSGWRLPYIHATLKKKLIKAKNESFLNCDLAQYTSSTVSRAMVQKKVQIYNGRVRNSKIFTPPMLGYKIGEYVFTKKFDGQARIKHKSKRRTKKRVKKK